MTPAYCDERLAEGYRRFRFKFAEPTLARHAVIVAGGTGGLRSATVARLAREGAQPVVGYRSNHERAEAFVRSVEDQCRANVTLASGDLAEVEARRALLS